MKNLGLSDLRLVSPRDGWPNPAASATASHAADLLESARLYGSVDEAVADLDRVYAATARTRFMSKAFVTSRTLPSDLLQLAAAASTAAAAAAAADAAASTSPPASAHAASSVPLSGEGQEAGPGPGSAQASGPPAAAGGWRLPRAGVLFGRESSGLTNEEVARANKVVTVEADPTYPVMNLAQAVVIMCYELFNARLDAAGAAVGRPTVAPSVTATASASSSSSASAPASAASTSPASASATSASATSATPSPLLPASSAEELRARAAALQLASRGDVEAFLQRLLAALEAAGFFAKGDDARRAATTRSIRGLAAKAEGLTVEEVALMHGMLTRLVRPMPEPGEAQGGPGRPGPGGASK
ncbi:hypothetical protein HYH03_015951 [Edaphochlamys debaryana]|uniref:tRNA/rRNA methyltransferase SpoU type domain-containing protein n=1 Tax=Edaphochlamys debaryana TaxID=47281 RepID=A0A836BQC7_9CHLO|nr:hypothetical protein HYH03_015951 [Edaphochlamys debaryana]|eukprot:KAG2485276.1 hypothetical protein HYH03_015951 [Edaphochlamys debaryana]